MRFACALLLFRTTLFAAEAAKLPRQSARERIQYLRQARIWEPIDVASENLYDGPHRDLKLAVDRDVTCDFYPKPMRGFTEKFLCRLDDGQILKVKYDDGPQYKEAVSEVLGTRLFWALGFYADTMFPVRVTCRHCPRQPWKYVRASKNTHDLDENGMIRSLPVKAEVGTYTFYPAAVEESLDVEPIEHRKNQGWSWRQRR